MKLTIALCAFLVSVWSPLSAANVADEQTVVMISIDGFRHDYIEKHQARNIAKLASEGVRARKLLPVYPTKTFPNHLSIITGLTPAKHGIVDNGFCDKTRNDCYKMGSGLKDSSWISGTPLWNLAEMQGVKAATYFWPESDARINGLTPSYFYHYSKYSDYQARLDQIINWLKLPSAQRPRFIAGYFSKVDSMGHEFGPDAPETFAAVQLIDGLIGDFAKRLETEIDVPVNLVLVSDHGMAKINPQQSISISSLDIDEDDFIVKNGSTRAHLYVKSGRSVNLAKEKARLNKLSKGRFHILDDAFLAQHGLLNHNRAADIILETTAPSVFSNNGEVDYLGMHGYRYSDDMAAFLVAKGPAFKVGFELEEVNNLDIYPTLAKLLGLTLLTPVDGDGASLAAALK